MQSLFDLFGDFDQIDLTTATGRTTDEDRTPLAQAQTLQDLEPDPHFLDRVTGQRDTQGIT